MNSLLTACQVGGGKVDTSNAPKSAGFLHKESKVSAETDL